MSNYSYAATNGVLWSHVGWIFFKSRYERMNLVDSTDLANDKGIYDKSRLIILPNSSSYFTSR